MRTQALSLPKLPTTSSPKRRPLQRPPAPQHDRTNLHWDPRPTTVGSGRTSRRHQPPTAPGSAPIIAAAIRPNKSEGPPSQNRHTPTCGQLSIRVRIGSQGSKLDSNAGNKPKLAINQLPKRTSTKQPPRLKPNQAPNESSRLPAQGPSGAHCSRFPAPSRTNHIPNASWRQRSAISAQKQS